MAQIWQTRSFPTEFHVHYICVPTAPSFNEGPSLGQGPLRPVLGAREFRASLPRHQGGAATADGLRPGNLLKTDTRLGIWENTPDITVHFHSFFSGINYLMIPDDLWFVSAKPSASVETKRPQMIVDHMFFWHIHTSLIYIYIYI